MTSGESDDFTDFTQNSVWSDFTDLVPHFFKWRFPFLSSAMDLGKPGFVGMSKINAVILLDCELLLILYYT